MKAKLESLELEKIELERKVASMSEGSPSENQDVNQNIIAESAQELGDIKYTILGKDGLILQHNNFQLFSMPCNKFIMHFHQSFE